MTNRAIAHARLRNSRLVGEPLARAVDVVRWFGAVQSQDIPGALWALGQRMPVGATMASVGAAFDAGEVVRTHVLRPTWHFVAPDELRWIQALTGERVHRANGTLNRRLGLDDQLYERVVQVLHESLDGGRIATRPELRDALARAGIAVADPLVPTFLVMRAELEGLIASGPRRGTQITYQLVDDRIAPTPARHRDDALRELVNRYFTSHGPATVHDASWWSGLTVSDIRRGVELGRDGLEERTIEDTSYLAGLGGFEVPAVPDPHVLLISNYDEVIGSYADYSPVVDAAFSPPNWVHDSIGPHVILRDGLVVGGWRRTLRPKQAVIQATLFADLTTDERAALDAQAEEFGRFFGVEVQLQLRSR